MFKRARLFLGMAQLRGAHFSGRSARTVACKSWPTVGERASFSGRCDGRRWHRRNAVRVDAYGHGYGYVHIFMNWNVGKKNNIHSRSVSAIVVVVSVHFLTVGANFGLATPFVVVAKRAANTL